MRRAFFWVEGVPQSVFLVIFQARLYCGRSFLWCKMGIFVRWLTALIANN
jgi:hypothetical protein